MKTIIAIVILLVCSPAFAMLDNGDGTRTFYVGTGKDFVTKADIVWGHPAGVMPGDKISGARARFDSATGLHKALQIDEDEDLFKVYREE